MTGAPVAGVRITGIHSFPEGQPSPPEVTAVTDETGAYTLSFPMWTPQELGGSSSTLNMSFELPQGYYVVGVSQSDGSLAGGRDEAMLLLDDLVAGPIDILLGQGIVVHGTVSNGLTGAPLAGIGVQALRLNSQLIDGSEGDAFEVESGSGTDANGRYSFTVRPGQYVIRADDGKDLRRFWSDDPAIFQATVLSVDRAVAGVDLVLVPVAPIHGEIRPCDACPWSLAGTQVVAYLADGACCHTVGAATTDDNLTFLMYLPPGRYRVAFQPTEGSPYAPQWWDGAVAFANATDITVGSEPVHLEAELASRNP